MSRRMRAGEGYSVDDAGLYPPPMGDHPRGRPRSRTFGDDMGPALGPPPAYSAAGAGTHGYGLQDGDGPRRNHRDSYRGSPVGHHSRAVDHRRPEDGRWTEHHQGEPNDGRRYRSSASAYPPSPPRHGRHGPTGQHEYDSAPPRRTKSTGGRRRVEESPRRPRRYESPEPPHHQSRHAPRDPRHDGRLSGYERDGRSPRDRGDRGDTRDPRRVRTANVPAYEDGYRPQPRRRGSLDGLDRGAAPRGYRHGGSPSPGPGPRARHRSVPPKSKTPKQQSAMGGIPWQAFAKTAFTVGAQAAFKARKDPSPWIGEKGARVATAALGAALVDGFVTSKHPNKVGSKRHKGLQSAATGAMDRAVAQGIARRGH